MKKLLCLLKTMLFAFVLNAQSLDTVSAPLTLRLTDWVWAQGKYGAGTDSASRSRIRALRDSLDAANPATWQTNVTITVSGHVIMYIYNHFMYAPFGEVLQMGSTTAERTTIYTSVRSINNSALQYFIGRTDQGSGNPYITTRTEGKEILLDQ